jgi:hypothetical protein
MYKVAYKVGTDVRYIDIDVTLSGIRAFCQTIRDNGGEIISVHKMVKEDVTAWATKPVGSYDRNWVNGEPAKEVVS